ncbi:MAG: bifunctional [glutamate--ammonia ligase]-adenylyl-L-tyrosine phosphorylase/[glutamate--ammonia-ligase] adenylyltransferase [Methylotenera sp.]
MSIVQTCAKGAAISQLQQAYLLKVEACSPFLTRLLSNDQELLADLLDNCEVSYQLAEMQVYLEKQEINNEENLKKTLRKLRQRVLARIILRDLNGLADFQEVVKTISDFADFCINKSVEFLTAWQEKHYGEPLDSKGNKQALVVIGMGKLGGKELNVSSDIDLIFAYSQSGHTNGENSISNQDYFVKLGKKFIAVLDDITEDGFVFRVDMRLRPFGSEGALVSNLDALEAYYQNNGREWERYAWIKGREITGGSLVSSLLKPFVYRKYLDYGAFASMRDLKVQIQREVNVRNAQTSGGQDNIKLGRGGIREIEFIAQVFQLIRGGQEPDLQIRPTLEVLHLIKVKHLLSDEIVNQLSEAYVFLRNLEHRLMYVEDAQTQDLPKTVEAQSRIASAMNFDSWQDLLSKLNHYRDFVQRQFDQTFSVKNKSQNVMDIEQEKTLAAAKLIWDSALSQDESISVLSEMGYDKPEDTLNQIQQLHQGHRYKQLPELSRQRFNRLLPLLIEVAGHEKNADIALMRTMDFVEAVCRRASYLAMMSEYPDALRLVVRLCAASAWCAQYLIKHPIVLDELLDEVTLYAEPDFDVMRTELSATMEALHGDTEQQMDAMRHFQHATAFRFAAQDIAGKLPLEKLSDQLSALADLIMDVSIKTIWASFKHKHIEVPKFAVIGYGKLGGKELGYASDLDIIFLYDDQSDDVNHIYARFAQRINGWFNSLTSAGLLYEIDLQLRPDGNSGLLVSSTDAFLEYQEKRAWPWEHQAITRARFVAGDANVGKRFEEIRQNVIKQARDNQKLSASIIEMREKMRQAQHLNAALFDLKHSPGGIIDVEFIVQYLVLANAAQHIQLTENIGNIALLSLLGDKNIIDQKLALQTADAYRAYRRLQHAARLQGDMQAKVNYTDIDVHAKTVNALWEVVFGVKAGVKS